MHKTIFEIIDNSDLKKIEIDKNFVNVHYLQSFNWCVSHDGYIRATTYKNNVAIATSIIVNKKLPCKLGSVCSINRGPIGESNSDIVSHLNDIKRYLSKKDVIHIMASPMRYGEKNVCDISDVLINSGWKLEYETLLLYKTTLVIDLLPTLAEIKSTFRRSLKTQLNKSDKLGINIIYEPDEASANEFFTCYNSMAHKRGLSKIDVSIQAFILSARKRAESKMILAYLNGKLISGLVLMKHGNRVIYEWGMNSMDPEFKSIPLAHKTHWEAIKWAKSCGYEHYDLGGYWLERGNKDPINYFKLGFTKNIETVTPEFYFILKPVRFYIVKILNKFRIYLNGR